MAAEENELMGWAQSVVAGMDGVQITDFTSSWRNGRAFAAVIGKHRPELLDYDRLLQSKDQPDFDVMLLDSVISASTQLGVTAPFTAAGFLESQNGEMVKEYVNALRTVLVPPVNTLRLVAIFDNKADDDDELSFAIGDIITDARAVDENWYLGKHLGKMGLVPAQYVQVLEEGPDGPDADGQADGAASAPAPSPAPAPASAPVPAPAPAPSPSASPAAPGSPTGPAPAGGSGDSSGDEGPAPAPSGVAGKAPVRTGQRKSGYLHKKGGWRHNWKRRWFTIYDGSLYYCDGQADTSQLAAKSKGRIALADSSVNPSPPPHHTHKFTFEVQVPERKYLVYAASQKDKDEWVDAIRAEIAQLKGLDAEKTS